MAPNLRTPPGLNPRDKRPGERRTLRTTARAGGPIWYFLGGLLLLVLLQTWFLAPTGRQISYSDFKQAVRAGQVAEVYVGDQTVHGTYTREVNGAKAFSSTRIEDPKLLEDLDAAGVKYTGELVSIGYAAPIAEPSSVSLAGVLTLLGCVCRRRRAKERFAQGDSPLEEGGLSPLANRS